jgi:hypothetical protein
MSLLLSVDPGVTCPGAAVFDLETKRLLHARHFKNTLSFSEHGLTVVRVLANQIIDWALGGGDRCGLDLVIEWPQIYGGGRSGGRKDPNDLLALAALDGALAMGMARYDGDPPVHYTPHEWKGSKKKNPTARMILDRLNEGDETPNVEGIVDFLHDLEKAEARGAECKHPTMNALDAVGVGLFHLGRLNRRRVIAR